MGVNASGPKSESITFRLESRILDNLKKKAKDEKISPNTLVSQIISDYFDWTMTAIDAGWMVMPKWTMRKVFEMLSQDQIVALADATYQGRKEMLIFMSGRDDKESFLTLVRIRAKKSGFHLRELEKDGKTTFIYQHDMGRNFSLFSKYLFEAIMHEYGVEVKLEATDQTVIMLF
jgi:hypothetical protein